MDFGIARSIGRADRGGDGRRSGRPAHLRRRSAANARRRWRAPSSAPSSTWRRSRRGAAVDQRADIYAFGLILYDMLVGRRRAEHARERDRRTAGADGDSRRRRRDRSCPRSRRRSTRLVARCLEPDREQALPDDRRTRRRRSTGSTRTACRSRCRAAFTPRMIAAAVVLVVASGTGDVVADLDAAAVPKQHDPVSVVIADFQNTTGDPTFDHTLEPMLQARARRRQLHQRVRPDAESERRSACRPPDEARRSGGARARGQAGRRRRPRRFDRPQRQRLRHLGQSHSDGDRERDLTSAKTRASSKDQVLGAATKLVDRRSARRSATRRRTRLSCFAMRSLSTTSLDVVSHYAAAIECAVQRQVRGRAAELLEGGGAGSEVRPRLPGPGRHVAQSRPAAGRREVHQGSAPIISTA